MILSCDKRIVHVLSGALCLFLAIAPSVLRAQTAPHIQWIQTYGGLRDDEAYGIFQTSDGFIVAGYTGDTVEPGLPDYHGGFEDAWVLGLDNSGNILWEKCLGGTLEEEANAMIQTKDGGCCLAIRTESSDDDVVDPDTNWFTGGSDGWIVKLTPDHQIQWATVIGGSNWDDVLSIVQSDDGGYAVGGYTASNDGCVTGHFGGDTIQDDDAWVTKLDANGKVQWSKCYGGLELDWAYGMVQTPDHGYCFVGNTASNDNEVSGNHGGISDAWVAKIDSIGNFQWGKCIGGSDQDWATSIVATGDSGFIVAGGTTSNDGDFSGNHGQADAWVAKLTPTGDIQWTKCFGGDTTDKAWVVIQTSDGGYLFTGMSQSTDDEVMGNHGNAGDAWVVKLDPSGNIEWQECVGGSKLDVGFNIIQLSNGDYALLGQTESSDGDILLNHGNEDIMLTILSNSSSVAAKTSLTPGSISLYPLPATRIITIDYNLPSATTNLRIEVRNILGMIVSTSIVNPGEAGPHETNLDLSGWMPGCYFVTLSAPGFYEAAPFQVIAQ